MRHDDRRTRSTRSGRGRAQTSACEDPLSLGAWAVRFAFPFQRAAAEMSSSHILRLSARCYCREVQGWPARCKRAQARSEEHTSELQSLMRFSYAVFCLHKNKICIKHLYTE